jgi:hypothetical protein
VADTEGPIEETSDQKFESLQEEKRKKNTTYEIKKNKRCFGSDFSRILKILRS